MLNKIKKAIIRKLIRAIATDDELDETKLHRVKMGSHVSYCTAEEIIQMYKDAQSRYVSAASRHADEWNSLNREKVRLRLLMNQIDKVHKSESDERCRLRYLDRIFR